MPTPIRVSVRIPGTSPVPELVRLIQDFEEAGFDGAGILDSQLLSRDVFIALAQAASQTSRLSLFPAVTNPFTRHVSVLAGAMQTAEELAPGRIQCVIGSGYSSAFMIGRKAATLAEMRQTIIELRTLLNGDPVSFHAVSGRLLFAAKRPIPVIMAASGPKAIELAGEVADGVMLLVGYTPGIVNAALEHLEAGARRSGRRLEDLEIIWAVRAGTAESTAEARRLARPAIVHWGLIHGAGPWLKYAGLQLPEYEIPQAIWDVKPDLAHAPDWEKAIEATSFVSDDVIAQLCDAAGFVGTPEYCAERVIEMSKHGVTNIYLMTLQTFVGPEREIQPFRDVIFPRLHAAGLR